MTMDPTSTPDVQRYLTEIHQVLRRSGVQPDEREQIADALREQIADMSATLGDPALALEQLDPPETFAATLLAWDHDALEPEQPTAPPFDPTPQTLDSVESGQGIGPSNDGRLGGHGGLDTLGLLSIGLCLVGLMMGVAIGIVGGLIGVPGSKAGYVLFFGAQLLAMGLGAVAFRHPLGRGGLVAAALLLSSSLILPLLFP